VVNEYASGTYFSILAAPAAEPHPQLIGHAFSCHFLGDKKCGFLMIGELQELNFCPD